MRFEHDSLHATLSAGVGPATWGVPLGVLVALFAVGASLVSASFVPVTIAFVAALCLLAAWTWRRSLRSTDIKVDARWLQLTHQPSGSSTRISLLDVHRAYVDYTGWLVIEPQPGPLSPTWIDARRTPRPVLDDLAAEITAAADRAGHRGDAPDEETRRVQSLLGRQTE